ncbi:MAG: DUF6449 domain-containing protein [Lachnospiraceae bacterium]|nr:DUF6449 domain-containing protein [Lachnospiraceae bacterium]
MTSKISFSKLVRNELHQMSWLASVWGVLFVLLIPFRVLLVMAVEVSRNWGDSVRNTASVFSSQVGLGHLENTIFILIAGAMCALCAFSYVHSAVKLDLYHSLALGRERLFAVRYFSSVLAFAIPYLVSQLLAVLIGVFYRVMTLRLLFEIAVASVQGILYFLISYSAVLLAVMLTGKLLTTVFAVGVMGFYIPFLVLIYTALQSVFYDSSLIGNYFDSSLPEMILRCSSPWAFCLFQPLQGKTMGVTGYFPTMGELCQLLALAAALTVLALLLYRLRKTEAAGGALAFGRTEGAVKLFLAVPTALAAALAANELFDSILWECVFILLFGTLACVIMEFIYRWDIRQVLRQKRYIAVTAALTAVLFFAMRFDITGYNTYIPAKEDVAAMSVRDRHFNLHYPKALGGYTYSKGDEKKLLDYFETEDFDLLYAMAENGVEHIRQGYGYGYEYEDFSTVYVEIKYRTKSGKETYRGYYVDQPLFLDTMDEMMKQKEFKEKYFPILTWSEEEISAMMANARVYALDTGWLGDAAAEAAGELEMAAGSGETAEWPEDEAQWDEDSPYRTEGGWEYADSSNQMYIDIPSSDVKRVVKAYCQDLETVTWRDLWMATDYLDFRKDQVSWYDDMYPLSEAFENTIEILKEIGGTAGTGERN